MNRKLINWLSISLLVIVVIISVISIEVLSNRHQTSIIQVKQQKASEYLSSFRYKLEARVLSDIYVAKTLATLTIVNAPSIEKHWNDVSRDILAQASDIRSLALAPNDVIQYVYPYQENKKAIGTDFRKIPEQWYTVNKARRIKKVFIARPVNLVQGGVGLIARYPVFLDPPDNQFYWGVISVVLNIDKLFNEIGLDELQKHYDVSIRGVDSQGPDGDIFIGEASTFVKPLSQEVVYFPYGSWLIALSGKPEANTFSVWVHHYSVRLVGYSLLIILLLVISVIYYLYMMAHKTSLYDELTKLPNRRYFMQTLDKIFQKKSGSKNQSHSSFAPINVDLNNFKEINDQYGHHIGDIVLERTAKQIVCSVKEKDFVARIGGDEFLIILSDVVSEAEVKAEVECIRSYLCSEVINIDDIAITVTASIGFSLYSTEIADYEDMLLQADVCMYEEKKQKP